MSFYYAVVDASGLPTNVGVAHDENGVPINTLDEYNKSVLGPLRVPAGGRVVVFTNAAEQSAWIAKLREAKSTGNTAAVVNLLSKPPSASVSPFPVIPIAIGATVLLLWFIMRTK